MNTLTNSIIKGLRTWTPQRIGVRFREQKPEYLRRYGYYDPVHVRGLLPRIKGDKEQLPIPVYRPKNSWCDRRALFGQNDYIDIMGDGSISPVRLLTHIPYWLRGFKGNEYRRLIRQHSAVGESMRTMQPKKYKDMQKRMKYVWSFLNRKLDLHR